MERIRAVLRRIAPLGDPAIVLLVAVLSVQPLLGVPVPPWAHPLVAAQCLPLALRRRLPFSVAAVCGLLTAVYGLSDLPDPAVPYAGLVSLYAVAAHGTRFAANAAGLVAAAAVGASLLLDPSADLGDATVLLPVFATAWLLGDGARRRRALAAETAARAEHLERTRTAEAHAAVAAERNRIAREMHDVVAHHIAMMVVQAEAGPVVAGTDPARAVDAFDAISAAGKQALSEMRRLVGVLKEGETPDLHPQPGVEDIGGLVDGVRSAGVDVHLHTTGSPRALPAAVDLSAYRVVQEALTNSLRHARPTRVDVGLVYDEHALRVTVDDDGAGAATAPRPGGHGLVGMRERVRLAGGTLDVGPGQARGWTVRAVLPLPTARHMGDR